MDDERALEIFSDKQLEEIKLGEALGVDTSIYAKPEFNWLQMEQIRLGLEEKNDVKQYAHEELSHETMKQIRLSYLSKVNLLPYIEKNFANKELEEIRLSLEEDLFIEQWLDPDMFAQQIREIRLGLEQGLNVGYYADIAYNWLQMQEIRKGLEERLDVLLYAKPLMDHKQMQEVRFGLEAGLDVSEYCNLTFTAYDMRKKRMELQNKQDEIKTPVSPVVEEIHINHEKQQLDISIMLEDNATKAYVFMEDTKKSQITKKALEMALTSRGITFGIDEEQIDAIVKKQMFGKNILIAEGLPAEYGEDGWYEFMVKTEGINKPDILPDGSVDYTTVDAIVSVEAGQVLAVYHPAGAGRTGRDVFGKEIPTKKGTEKPTLKGYGFTLEPDRVTYIAKIGGQFNYVEGKIEVNDVVIVEEDVTAVTGRIDVDGSVHVFGSVLTGAFIKATGDIIIENNVETGRLIAGGNILVKRGCCSLGECYLNAERDISGKFFEGAELRAQGDIRANYVMNCQIYTMGRVVIAGNRGMLFGGKTLALRGVDAFNLGNNSNLLTVLDVGKNEIYQEKMLELKEEKEKNAEEIFIYKDGLRKISKEAAENNSDLAIMRAKIKTAIKMKQEELQGIEKKIKKLADIVEKGAKTPITVLGTVYAGTLIMIDGSKYLVDIDMKRVSFKRREKEVVIDNVRRA